MADITTAATELIGKIPGWLPAAAGALISMKFLPVTLTKGQRFSSALAAYVIGTYFGRGICEQLSITSPRAVDAIVFGVALFGMAVVGTLLEETKPLVRAVLEKFFGVKVKEDN